MDSDSVITFLFIFAFFVLPSILKQIKARKKKAPQPRKVNKNKKIFSIFGRIGEQIRQFVRELEKQTRIQRQAGKEQGTVWETLAPDGEVSPDFEKNDEDADFYEAEPEVVKQPVTDERQPQSTGAKSSFTEFEKSVLTPAGSRPGRFKTNPLQNAIVWSEILSKPVALRKK